MSRPVPNLRRPVCPALILCETVRTDLERGRIDLFNVMNGVFASTFPADVSFAVHFSLTDGAGEYRMAMVVEFDQGEERVTVWEGKLTARTPNVVSEQPVFLTLKFSHPGRYWIKLFANGDLINQRGFDVVPEAPPS